MNWPDFLPGHFTLARGTAQHYARLHRFHYLPRRPATWAGVWVVHYHDPGPGGHPHAQPLLVAVGVVSYPAPTVHQRDRIFNMTGKTRAARLRFANTHIRTISRVIVHPQFRALGLGVRLVQHMCANCPTRYVEALAVMAHVHPLFDRAGMTRHNPPAAHHPVYYLFDRRRNDQVKISKLEMAQV